jgi:26S proteasome regulatory subunit N7
MDLAFTDSTAKKRGPTKQWTEKEVEEELKKFDAKIEEAKEQAGDVEVRDAILDKAMFLKEEARDYPEAERVFREAYAKSGGASKKMEILFEILLMNIEKFDMDALKKDVN